MFHFKNGDRTETAMLLDSRGIAVVFMKQLKHYAIVVKTEKCNEYIVALCNEYNLETLANLYAELRILLLSVNPFPNSSCDCVIKNISKLSDVHVTSFSNIFDSEDAEIIDKWLRNNIHYQMLNL